jgi:rubrerythrin
VTEAAVENKTRKIDFEKLTLMDALDLAVLVEEEAKDRYGEFAHQMETHHNPDAARFFNRMLQIESSHESKLADRRRELFGSAPVTVSREMIFDIEAPEYDEARAAMSVRQALQSAMRSEQKAYAFFDEALKVVKDTGVRVLFEKLRAEEEEHQGYVKKELDRLPADPAIDGEAFEDDPVAVD